MKKKLTSSAFQSPNYTQTPNDFFQLISDMEETELKVTLVMIRATFGFHRNSFKMGVKKIARATGLSLNGARAGAEAAEERGTFRRTNADAQGEAEWELIVEDALDEWGAASEWEGVQPVNPTHSTIAPQSPIKESIKETELNVNERTATLAKLYSANIGVLTPILSDKIKTAAETFTDATWYEPAFEVAVFNNARNWNYVETVLTNWKDKGRGWKPTPMKTNSRAKVAVPMQFDAQGNVIG